MLDHKINLCDGNNLQVNKVTNFIGKALAKRQNLLTDESNAVRIFDGAGDGVAGITIDSYADTWIVATQGERIPEVLFESISSFDKSVYWKKLSQAQMDSPKHFSGDIIDIPFVAKESGVNYEINYQAGYSQGIFLDQRENRKEVMNRAKEGDSVLNTFAYTGAFSVCAALQGATTTTLDLSQPYLDWGKRNFQLNSLNPDEHHWCKGDTFHWLDRFAKKGRKFNGIILDPPTFSRDSKGKVFRVEKDYARLVELAVSCLAPNGWILASTNCRKLNDAEFLAMVKEGCHQPHKAKLKPMPQEYKDIPFLKTVWLDF